MARSKNSLTDVGVGSGQFKSSFSYGERATLDSAQQISGTFGPNASQNVYESFKNFSADDYAKQQIGGLIAEGLERQGITRQVAGNFLSTNVSNAIDKRQSLFTYSVAGGLELNDPKNRLGNPNNRSPSEQISRNRETIGGSSSIVFPPDLEQNAQTYIKLKFYRYSRNNPFVSGSVSDDFSIDLPLPEGFTQEFSVEYSALDTSYIQALAGMTGFDTGEITPERIRQAFAGLGDTSVSQAAEFLKSVGQYTATTMLSSGENVVGGLITRGTGRIANPHPSVFFNGVNLRSYDMSWKLVPRSQTEATIIKDLIKTIKDKALPKISGSGNFLTYPRLVQPLLINATFGQDYKKSHIASISINYSAEGTSAFFYDGQPVAIQLSLGFREAELYLEEDTIPPPLLSRIE